VPDHMEIVCHRGANQYAPENTYASAVRCIDWEMDYLEIDVNTSRDGVMYLFHGPDLSRTTAATGKIYEWDSAELDELDCGSWFDPSFHGERIPRLEDFLRWVDHRIKIFFDVKYADLEELVDMVYRLSLQEECFFWFGRPQFAQRFVEVAPKLPIKINVRTADDVKRAKEEFDASIVELYLEDMRDEVVDICRELDVKTMILQRELDLDAFQRVLDWNVDMVNVDHADHFAAFIGRR